MASPHLPLSVIIEPSPPLAETLTDILRMRGFDVLAAATHVGAAQLALTRERVDFLIAAVPAPGENRAGAFLESARESNPGMAMIVLLSDPDETVPDAPGSAVRLIKPFSLAELEAAVDRAGVFAGSDGAQGGPGPLAEP